MRFLTIITALTAPFIFGGWKLAAEENKPLLTVVELFTSQACPRSPVGDGNVAALTSRNDVLALTFPVTYWNYLGWADTLAKEAFDDRQKFYIERAKDQWLYTPHVVIQGKKGISAENMETLEGTIAEVAKLRFSLPEPIFSEDRKTLTVLKTDLLQKANAVFQVVFYERGPVEVKVTGGKNAGKTLSYVNVVRALQETTDGNITVPEEYRDLSCAVLMQNKADGSILGASLCPGSGTPASI